jgi:hypothetical protein
MAFAPIRLSVEDPTHLGTHFVVESLAGWRRPRSAADFANHNTTVKSRRRHDLVPSHFDDAAAAHDQSFCINLCVSARIGANQLT